MTRLVFLLSLAVLLVPTARAEICYQLTVPGSTMAGRPEPIATVYRCGDPANPSTGGLHCEAASSNPDDTTYYLVCDPGSAIGSTASTSNDEVTLPAPGSNLAREEKTVEIISNCFTVLKSGRERCKAQCEARASRLLEFQNATTQSVLIGANNHTVQLTKIPISPPPTCQGVVASLTAGQGFRNISSEDDNALPAREADNGNSAYSMPVLPSTTTPGAPNSGAAQ